MILSTPADSLAIVVLVILIVIVVIRRDVLLDDLHLEGILLDNLKDYATPPTLDSAENGQFFPLKLALLATLWAGDLNHAVSPSCLLHCQS